MIFFAFQSLGLVRIGSALIYHLPLVIGLQACSFWLFGLYRGVWRFASLPDLNRIIKSIMLGALLIVLSLFFTTRLDFVPRSVLPVYTMMLIFILGGARFVYRWSKDRQILPYMSQKRVLVVGAGKSGDIYFAIIDSMRLSGL
jgi:FlaA1/EpsC-like NDP-sugar epimerase